MPRGFTLIEILIAVSILGLLGFIAVPSVARFSSDQTLSSQANELVSNIRTAQNNSKNKILCPSSTVPTPVSKIWFVMFKSSSSYQMATICSDNSISTYPAVNLSPELSLSVCGNNFSNANISWINSTGQIQFRCGPQIDSDLVITLTNTKTQSQRTITVTKGGVININ